MTKRRHRAHVHLAIAVALGFVADMLAPRGWGQIARLVLAWDVGAMAWVLWTWAQIGRATAAQTQLRAAAEDPGRTAVWILTTGTSALTLLATGYLIRRADHAMFSRQLVVLLSLAAIVTAWAATHTAYTLRYAHLHYRDRGRPQGGVKFPDDEPPSYLDFGYLSFTVGMCFQVSDVSATSREFRAAVLSHALLSFAYNTVILAVAVNLLVGSIQ